MRALGVILLCILFFCLGSWAGCERPRYIGINCEGGNAYEPLYADEESAFPLCEEVHTL